MIRTLLPLAALSLLAACDAPEKAAPVSDITVTVTDALCRPTPVGRQMTGCYMTLTASGDDRLVSIASPVAGRIEIHESKIEGGMMMMTEMANGVPLPAGQAVELKPGGNHIMLLAVADPLTVGETVPLTLTFASAAPVEVAAPVAQPPVAIGAAPAAH
ncbi:copper chaperone PCu(A)C [Brevundimonas lenta]